MNKCVICKEDTKIEIKVINDIYCEACYTHVEDARPVPTYGCECKHCNNYYDAMDGIYK